MNYLPYLQADEHMTYLQKARNLNSWTQEKFAQRLGVSRSYCSQIETGFYPCPDRLLERISKVLNVKMKTLRQKMTGRRFLKRQSIKLPSGNSGPCPETENAYFPQSISPPAIDG